ncbi:hypothetical protein M9458_010930, partial [Cirrhinus mrigala]
CRPTPPPLAAVIIMLHVAISAISANMDSFARGRTAILKKQPSHMEAAHFGDL